MKTTMKLFAAIAIMAGFSMTSFGQSAFNTIAASATVVDVISVAATQSLEFGNLSISGPKTVTLAGVGQGGVTGGGEHQGYYTIAKGAGTSVNLSYTTIPDKLLNGSAKLPITYVSTWGTDNTTGVGGTAVNVALNATTTVPQGTTAPTIFVHLAGTVTPNVNAPDNTVPGSYTNNVTLTATFN